MRQLAAGGPESRRAPLPALYNPEMEIDWLEVGKGVALLLAGAGAAAGVLKKFFADWFTGKPKVDPAPLPVPVDDKLLPAVLAALESARDACEEAVQNVRSASLTAVQTQAASASIVGAMREVSDRLNAIEARLRRVVTRAEKTAEHPAPRE